MCLQGFAIVEYMNDQSFIDRFILVRNQVRTQLGYIEAEFLAAGHPVTGRFGKENEAGPQKKKDFFPHSPRNPGHLLTYCQGITQWWDVVLDDFMDQLEERVRTFTSTAVAAAFAPFDTQAGRRLAIYQQVYNTLVNYENMRDNGQGLTLSPRYFLAPRPP